MNTNNDIEKIKAKEKVKVLTLLLVFFVLLGGIWEYQNSYYVSMQIDKNYSSRIHTIKVSAYYNGILLREDFKEIDEGKELI